MLALAFNAHFLQESLGMNTALVHTLPEPILFQIFPDTPDHFYVQQPLLFHKAEQKRKLAYNINEPRNALGKFIYIFKALVAEDTLATNMIHAVLDIIAGLFKAKGAEMIAQHYTLPELLQLRDGELIAKLGLTGQDYLKELMLVRLKV